MTRASARVGFSRSSPPRRSASASSRWIATRAPVARCSGSASRDSLGAVGRAEPAQQVADVLFDRVQADHQLVSDPRVGHARRRQYQTRGAPTHPRHRLQANTTGSDTGSALAAVRQIAAWSHPVAGGAVLRRDRRLFLARRRRACPGRPGEHVTVARAQAPSGTGGAPG